MVLFGTVSLGQPVIILFSFICFHHNNNLQMAYSSFRHQSKLLPPLCGQLCKVTQSSTTEIVLKGRDIAA